MKLEKLYNHGIFDSLINIELSLNDASLDMKKDKKNKLNKLINSIYSNLGRVNAKYLKASLLDNWNNKIKEAKKKLIDNDNSSTILLTNISSLIKQFTNKTIKKDKEEEMLFIGKKQKKDYTENKESNNTRQKTLNERYKDSKTEINSFYDSLLIREKKSRTNLILIFILGILILIGFYFFIKYHEQKSTLLITSYIIYFLSLSITLSFYIYYYKLSNSLRKKIFTIKELDIMTMKLDPSKEVFYTEKYIKSILEVNI